LFCLTDYSLHPEPKSKPKDYNQPKNNDLGQRKYKHLPPELSHQLLLHVNQCDPQRMQLFFQERVAEELMLLPLQQQLVIVA